MFGVQRCALSKPSIMCPLAYFRYNGVESFLEAYRFRNAGGEL